jgi:hypothetical protein
MVERSLSDGNSEAIYTSYAKRSSKLSSSFKLLKDFVSFAERDCVSSTVSGNARSSSFLLVSLARLKGVVVVEDKDYGTAEASLRRRNSAGHRHCFLPGRDRNHEDSAREGLVISRILCA